MKKVIATLMLAALLISPAYAEDQKGHDHGKKQDGHKGHDHEKHEAKGKNGGTMFEVGEGIADLEFVHDEKTGTVKIFVYKEGSTTPLKIVKAPRLNITLKGGRKQIKTTAVKPDADKKASAFIAINDLFKSEFEGEISIKIAGKSYKVKLVDEHAGHDHSNHEGHKH